MAHPFLVKMCEVILNGGSDYPQYNDKWSPADKKNALAYLKTLESFEFIFSMVTLSQSLLYLEEAVVKLQRENRDLVSGVSSVMESCSELKKLRDVDSYSKIIFAHSSRIAAKSGIAVAMPRVSRQQQHRSNPEHISIED